MSFFIFIQLSQQEYLDRKVVVSKGILLSGSKVRGRKNNLRSYDLKNVEEFRGIFYAKLHVQFMVSRSPQRSMESFIYATEYRPVCPQRYFNELDLTLMPDRIVERLMNLTKRFTKNQSEQCLSLNVFLPEKGTVAFAPLTDHT